MTRSPRLVAGALTAVLTMALASGLPGSPAGGAPGTYPATAACAAVQQQDAAARAVTAAAKQSSRKAGKRLDRARKVLRAQATTAHAKTVRKATKAKNERRRALRSARSARATIAGSVAATCTGTIPGTTPGATPGAVAPAATRLEDPVAHDPTVVKEGEWYYLAITGDAATGRDYLPMKRSRDLLHWEQLAPVFTELPAEVVAAIPDTRPASEGGVGTAAPMDAWAPDLSWTGTEWRLYYSASRFGTTNSVTALATSTTLDPASPDFGWVDQGIVLETESDAAYNAIDANYVQDAQGGAWLTFGSFFGGLQIVALDPATGKLAAGAAPQTIVRRPIRFNPVEGPSVIRHGDYYYLFAAFDYCCRGAESDYRVVVGRATSVTGPYVDKAGVSLLDGGGTEVLRGYNEFQGTGHPDTFSADGVDYLVNHYYDLLSDPTPRLNVRRLTWADDWPTVGDPANPSRWAGHGSAYVQVIPRGSSAAVGAEACGYAEANLALASSSPADGCQQWQIDARDARQVTDGSETGSRFQNRNANMAADFPGCAEATTTGNVAQFDWLGNFFYNVCQRWVFSPAADGFTTVTSIAGRGLVWTAEGLTPGSNLGVATPAGAADQQFRFQPVGEVLLGGAADRAQALGVTGCRSGRVSGELVEMQTRSVGACQTWTVTPTGTSTPGAGYTVTNVATDRRLASTGCIDETPSDALELVASAAPASTSTTCSTWTVVPRNDGTWSLDAAGSTQTVRLLIP